MAEMKSLLEEAREIEERRNRMESGRIIDNQFKIDPSLIPDYVMENACRILEQCIRRARREPGYWEQYEVFKETKAGQRAMLRTPKERAAFDAANKKSDTAICVICGREYTTVGNEAEPVTTGECCNDCNIRYVVPARVEQLRKARNGNKDENDFN